MNKFNPSYIGLRDGILGLAPEEVHNLLEAISKKSFGPNSLLSARFKSSKYQCIPPV